MSGFQSLDDALVTRDRKGSQDEVGIEPHDAIDIDVEVGTDARQAMHNFGGIIGMIGNQKPPPVLPTVETTAGKIVGTMGVSSPGGIGSSGASTGNLGNE